MNLSPQQVEILRRIAKSEEGRFLQEVLFAYILEIKDECIFGDLSKEAAKSATAKLEEFRDKLGRLAADQPVDVAKNIHR